MLQATKVPTQQAMRYPEGNRKGRKAPNNPAPFLNEQKPSESTEPCASDAEPTQSTAAPVSGVTFDSLRLIGAEAYLQIDSDQVQQQRQANLKIRSLLDARKRGSGTTECSHNVDTPQNSSGDSGAAADAATVGIATAGVRSGAKDPTTEETERSASPLPEFAALPDLPEDEPPRLRPWQHQQHHQLLRLQERQLHKRGRMQNTHQQSLQPSGHGEGSQQTQKKRQTGEISGAAAAATGVAAVAAAGAAAADAGADFFGRLHAECITAVGLLKPSEEEERKKREAAGRVRAVCRLLWSGCTVEVFGSCFTALSLPGSDLDVCVFSEEPPPLHDYYACSRCLCCSSSKHNSSNNSSSDGSTSRGSSSSCSSSTVCGSSSIKRDMPVPRSACGAQSADRGCCCTSLSKQRKRSSMNSNGLCRSKCCHGGAKGYGELLRAMERQRDRDDTHSRLEAVRKIRDFARCLRELNDAAATTKRRGSRIGGESGKFADNIELILSARVPICRFRDSETGVAVDLSFDKPSSVLTSLYVRHKLNDFVLLRPLLLINKMLLRHWQLHEPFKGGVGPYLLFVMCLHFLQNNPHLSDSQKYRHLNLGHVLFQFLHYFGLQFNYETSAISVHGAGSLVRKDQGRWRGVAKSREESVMLSAENPFDPSHDLGRSARKIMHLRTAWRKAYLRLASRLMSEIGRAPQDGEGTLGSQEPLLNCIIGSSTWPEELEAQRSSSDGWITTPQPGLCVTKDVAAATEAAVDSLAGSSAHLRRFLRVSEGRLSNPKEVTSNCIRSHADTDVSSDSDTFGSMRRRPWERKLWRRQNERNKPSQVSASMRPNTHVIFDSSESESSSASDSYLPVRGFASADGIRSSRPCVAVAGAGRGVARTTPVVAGTSAARTSKGVVSSPSTIISVGDSSDTDSSVLELSQRQANREANKQKRKRRKQRQAAEKRRGLNSKETPASPALVC